MPVDLKYLRQHYASMPDDELLAVDREDLVPAAQEIYDAEVRQRDLGEPESDGEREGPTEEDLAAEPDWLEDAAEAFSMISRPGQSADEVAAVRHALDEDGIPVHVEVLEEADDASPEAVHRWQVLVPGKMLHRAMSVIDRDIFNEQFESAWKNHLEVLDNDDLRVMEPRYAFCGLYDKLERINRAYNEELKRRQLK